jgi:DNA-binding CsgD family transcriptional regulator
VAVVGVTLLLPPSALLLGETAVTSLWGLLPKPGAMGAPAPELPPGLVAGRCAEMATACRLTRREQEILLLLAEGKTTDQISEALVISDSTVRTHAKRVHEKLGVHSQQQLIRMIVFASQEDHRARTNGDPVLS